MNVLLPLKAWPHSNYSLLKAGKEGKGISLVYIPFSLSNQLRESNSQVPNRMSLE
jgi:hypothetical protein